MSHQALTAVKRLCLAGGVGATQQRSYKLWGRSKFQQQRGRVVYTRANSNNGAEPTKRAPEPSFADSDVAFVAKLAIVSFTLGAVIKYGSLFLDQPFEHDPTLALTMVVTPPTAYAVYLLWRQQQQQ